MRRRTPNPTGPAAHVSAARSLTPAADAPRPPDLYRDRIPALAPFAQALLAHHAGEADGELRLRSSLGDDEALPVEFFFRNESRMLDVERYALELCRGRVLDLGAGAGPHTLALQARGRPVVSVEVSTRLAGLLRDRGAASVVCADFRYWSRPGFDTVLMLMNGLGPVGTLAGLERLLSHARRCLAPGGQLLVDGAAARRGGPTDTASWPTTGEYEGQAWIELSYGGRRGRPFRELYVDADTLARRADATGWRCEIAFATTDDAYLARLTRSPRASVRPPG